jgi:hypothetical protein
MAGAGMKVGPKANMRRSDWAVASYARMQSVWTAAHPIAFWRKPHACTAWIMGIAGWPLHLEVPHCSVVRKPFVASPGRMAQPRVDEGPIGRLEDDD